MIWGIDGAAYETFVKERVKRTDDLWRTPSRINDACLFL